MRRQAEVKRYLFGPRINLLVSFGGSKEGGETILGTAGTLEPTGGREPNGERKRPPSYSAQKRAERADSLRQTGRLRKTP